MNEKKKKVQKKIDMFYFKISNCSRVIRRYVERREKIVFLVSFTARQP